MKAVSQLGYQMIESEVENSLWEQEFMFHQPSVFPNLQIQQSQDMFPETPHWPYDWPSKDSGNKDKSAFYDIFSSWPSPPFSEISTEDSTGSLETEELMSFERSSIPTMKMGVESHFGGKQLPTTNDTNRSQFPTIESLLTDFAQEPVRIGNVSSNGAQAQCRAQNNYGEEGGSKKELNTDKDRNNEGTWERRKHESDNKKAKAMIESEVEHSLWEQEFIFNQPSVFPDLQLQQSQNMFPETPHWPSQVSENDDISALGEFYHIFSSCPSPAFSEISTEEEISTDSLDIEELTLFENSSIPHIKMGADSYLDDNETNTNPLPSIKSLLTGFPQEPVLLGNVPSNGVMSQCRTHPDNKRNTYCEQGGSKKKINTNKDRNNESTGKKRKHESDTSKNEGGKMKLRDFSEAERQTSSVVQCQSSAKPEASLEFMNLQSTYFKVQKRSLIASEQRLSDAQVSMVARSKVPIQSIQVSVKRCENGKPENDTLGPVRLSTKQELDEYEEQVQKIQFSVDLDSVYRTKEGLEVYNLKKINIHLANTWRLLVILQLTDGCFEVFESKPFLVKTRRYKNDTKT